MDRQLKEAMLSEERKHQEDVEYENNMWELAQEKRQDEIAALIKLAYSNPDYRLAVVDTTHGMGFEEEYDHLLVIKMAD